MSSHQADDELPISAPIKFKDWDKEKPKLVAAVRRSERLTARDLAVRINPIKPGRKR